MQKHRTFVRRFLCCIFHQHILVRDGRLELPTSCSQSKRATNCANPGFLVIEFCSRCGQTCGQAVFLTISACGGSACIAGVSRDCGHGIFWLEGGATRSQMWRPTNWATPGYLLVTIIARNSCDSKFFPVCGHLCGQSDFATRFCCRVKSRKLPCCKGFRALAVRIVDRQRNAPKASALPTALIPDMKFRLIRRPDVLTQECVCKWLRHRT